MASGVLEVRLSLNRDDAKAAKTPGNAPRPVVVAALADVTVPKAPAGSTAVGLRSHPVEGRGTASEPGSYGPSGRSPSSSFSSRSGLTNNVGSKGPSTSLATVVIRT